MKRFLLPILGIMLILILFNGCSKKENIISATPTEKANLNVTLAPTATTPEPTATIAPILTEQVYMIEDFNSMTDPLISMKPADLSSFGILYPEMTLGTGYAEADNAMTVSLNPATWCQLFQIDDTTRLNIFKENAKNEYYIRVYVANLSQIPLCCTVMLSNGLQMSFIDANKVILTDTQGLIIENETSNATGNGEESAITVPGGFIGWVAWPLSDEALKAWGGTAVKFSDFSSITNISFDIRPVSPMEEDFYVLDNICITNKPS